MTPAYSSANNGNWHTAARWKHLLGRHCRIGIVAAWDGEACDLLIALHARRSAPSIQAYAAQSPDRPIVVVLTGTDLYRDLPDDPAAQRSLRLASHLVVLQDAAPGMLSAADRAKCHVIYQSAPALRPAPTPLRRLRIASVGHLRDEKDPSTFMRAAARLGARADLRFEHIGAALDPDLHDEALRTAATCPTYRWLGNLPRAQARQHIRRAHLLVNTSRMEGGAQVIVEAARSGTAVLASRVDGNVGMLGAHYPGFFAVGDDVHLACLVERAGDDAAFLAQLRAQTLARATLFDPPEERQRLLALVYSALRRPVP